MRHGVNIARRAYLHNVNEVVLSTGRRIQNRQYSTTKNGEQQIAVLGGGITGLASAYYLTQRLPRAKVTVFEGGPRLGGWLSSNRVEVSGGSILFEGGPRSLRTASNGILACKLVSSTMVK